jgi:hypothetical protein
LLRVLKSFRPLTPGRFAEPDTGSDPFDAIAEPDVSEP